MTDRIFTPEQILQASADYYVHIATKVFCWECQQMFFIPLGKEKDTICDDMHYRCNTCIALLS